MIQRKLLKQSRLKLHAQLNDDQKCTMKWIRWGHVVDPVKFKVKYMKWLHGCEQCMIDYDTQQ